jgi:predicted NBD/HSP70 family sugar kinase
MGTNRHTFPVAEGLVLYGTEDQSGLDRDELLEDVDVGEKSFVDRHGLPLGAKPSQPGERFFDYPRRGRLAFGPGAGLCLGISVGTESLRGAIVDANGWIRVEDEESPLRGQTKQPHDVVLDRVHLMAGKLLRKAVAKKELLVDGKLPLLGCAVAWPSPVNRSKYATSYALPEFGGDAPLTALVQERLGVKDLPVYALNDTRAAALAVAYHTTKQVRHAPMEYPELTIVVRLAGGIGGAVTIIEPPRDRKRESDRYSGFLWSTILAGAQDHAGELGHVAIADSVINELNRDLPDGLPRLAPITCSCEPDDPPPHLEAFASAVSMARRLDSERAMHEVLSDVLAAPTDPLHARVLRDVGALVGEALVAPTVFLNPARIVLTGSLAVKRVRDEVEARLKQHRMIGKIPRVESYEEPVNKFLRAHGAALAMIRVRVLRELDEILVAYSEDAVKKVRELTHRLGKDSIEELFPEAPTTHVPFSGGTTAAPR